MSAAELPRLRNCGRLTGLQVEYRRLCVWSVVRDSIRSDANPFTAEYEELKSLLVWSAECISSLGKLNTDVTSLPLTSDVLHPKVAPSASSHAMPSQMQKPVTHRSLHPERFGSSDTFLRPSSVDAIPREPHTHFRPLDGCSCGPQSFLLVRADGLAAKIVSSLGRLSSTIPPSSTLLQRAACLSIDHQLCCFVSSPPLKRRESRSIDGITLLDLLSHGCSGVACGLRIRVRARLRKDAV